MDHYLPSTMAMSDLTCEIAVAAHPTDRLLRNFVANELGARPKRVVSRHLEDCDDCRSMVSNLRAASRRLRDFERLALATAQPSRY